MGDYRHIAPIPDCLLNCRNNAHHGLRDVASLLYLTALTVFEAPLFSRLGKRFPRREMA